VTDSVVRIGLLFPELLGTYGDRGNAVALERRLTRRAIAAEVVTVSASDVIPRSLDCYVIGGGENHTERAAAELLCGSDLIEAWSRGAVIVAVCAGYQLLGTSIRIDDGEPIRGVGLLNATTELEATRRVGDVVVDTECEAVGAVCGFENHAGVTTLHSGPPPLGTIRGDDRRDGVFGANILGTYLHGPVLVRNPDLTDAVLAWIVGALPALPPDDLEHALHDSLVARITTPRRWRRRR
jgi:lipid II isoglutaminyl synthase (glutamine-hydrolysing)